jgi:hypothetical protein
VHCTLYNGVFSLAHKARDDIEDHLKTVKHMSAINAPASANIRDVFKAKNGNSGDLQCAAIEAAFSYHTARYELSLNTSHCTYKLIKK